MEPLPDEAALPQSPTGNLDIFGRCGDVVWCCHYCSHLLVLRVRRTLVEAWRSQRGPSGVEKICYVTETAICMKFKANSIKIILHYYMHVVAPSTLAVRFHSSFYRATLC